MSQDTYPYDYQNPVELNRYVYTANNPVNLVDPSGYSALLEKRGDHDPALRVLKQSKPTNIVRFTGGWHTQFPRQLVMLVLVPVAVPLLDFLWDLIEELLYRNPYNGQPGQPVDPGQQPGTEPGTDPGQQPNPDPDDDCDDEDYILYEHITFTEDARSIVNNGILPTAGASSVDGDLDFYAITMQRPIPPVNTPKDRFEMLQTMASQLHRRAGGRPYTLSIVRILIPESVVETLENQNYIIYTTFFPGRPHIPGQQSIFDTRSFSTVNQYKHLWSYKDI